jgi:hypothetical protein
VSAYVGRDAVSDEAIREMLREWRQPAAEGRASTVPAKRLRFAEAGRTLTHSQIGEWARLVVAAITGRLPDGVAPCTPHLAGDPNGVRSLSREEVDWTTLEPREWAMMERAGLSRATRLRLEAGEPVEAPQEADPSHEAAISAARALLSHVPDGTPADRVCIVLPTGTRWGAYDEDLRASGLATAAIASPDNDAQRDEIIRALATGSTLEVFY